MTEECHGMGHVPVQETPFARDRVSLWQRSANRLRRKGRKNDSHHHATSAACSPGEPDSTIDSSFATPPGRPDRCAILDASLSGVSGRTSRGNPVARPTLSGYGRGMAVSGVPSFFPGVLGNGSRALLLRPTQCTADLTLVQTL